MSSPSQSKDMPARLQHRARHSIVAQPSAALTNVAAASVAVAIVVLSGVAVANVAVGICRALLGRGDDQALEADEDRAGARATSAPRGEVDG